jgi:hypothetical protein
MNWQSSRISSSKIRRNDQGKIPQPAKGSTVPAGETSVGGNMNNEETLAVFEDYRIRRIYDEDSETWYFSVADIIATLLQQPDFQTTCKYWNKLKERLKKVGSPSMTNCHRLKSAAADGKYHDPIREALKR